MLYVLVLKKKKHEMCLKAMSHRPHPGGWVRGFGHASPRDRGPVRCSLNKTIQRASAPPPFGFNWAIIGLCQQLFVFYFINKKTIYFIFVWNNVIASEARIPKNAGEASLYFNVCLIPVNFGFRCPYVRTFLSAARLRRLRQFHREFG